MARGGSGGASWRSAATRRIARSAGIAALPIFRVQRIVVHGNHRLSNGEVLALLDGLRGQSILTVDLDEWRDAVLSSPWVAEALLRRTLPSTVEVSVQERQSAGHRPHQRRALSGG